MNLFEFLFFIFSSSLVSHNPITEPNFPVIQNQGFTSELNRTYLRFPLRAKKIVNNMVWELSQNSAGLAVYFKTNSSIISITYQCTGPFSMIHMPGTGVSGISLITRNEQGLLGTIQSSFTFQSSNKTVKYDFNDNRKSDSEYKLYLPLYNTIKNLEIEVTEGSSFTWIEKDYSLPIVIYGTSIVQGCCSATPSQSWSNIVQMHFNVPVLNFGFSGSAKLEENVLRIIIENKAKLYILDCLPNLYYYSIETIKNRVFKSIQLIRNISNAPILLVDFVGLNFMHFNNATLNQINNANNAQREIVENLKSKGVLNLFYLDRNDIHFEFDCWVDFIHPNNLGMKIYANTFIKKIDEILFSKSCRLKIEIVADCGKNENIAFRCFWCVLILVLCNFLLFKIKNR